MLRSLGADQVAQQEQSLDDPELAAIDAIIAKPLSTKTMPSIPDCEVTNLVVHGLGFIAVMGQLRLDAGNVVPGCGSVKFDRRRARAFLVGLARA